MTRVSLTEDGIQAVLSEEGYDVKRITDGTFRGSVFAAGRNLPFHVHLDVEGFLVCAILRFVRSPEYEHQAERLYKRLLELNQELMMAKLSIDDDLDVILSVEYPAAELDRSEVADAIRVLAHYANQLIDELEDLAAGLEPPARMSSPPDLRRTGAA
jgi:hypothetical protein